MPRNVLVVDDSPIARLITKKCVSTAAPQCTLHEAVNGLDGVEKFREINPEITLMDLTMPVMDGIEALSEIRKINPEAIIIVATADIQEITIARAMAAGAYAVMQKPLSSQALDEVFQRIKGNGDG
jgi:two-component system chemotaxis response regulator CheY